MKNTNNKITKAILKKTIAEREFVVQDFFVGLTDNPKKRLFLEHKVDQKKGLYTYYKAGSSKEAKSVFDELFQLDMNGDPERKTGRYVYCYHINGLTEECPTCH